jgi:hypothetical protein
MWELATKYFQPPLNIDKFADRKLASFLISNDPSEIKKCSHGLENRKLPTGAIHEIEAVQPYNAGYEPLWWLTELVNQDKHRMFLLTVGVVESVTVKLSSWPLGPLQVGEDTITIPGSDLAASGNPTIQSDMQMKAKPTIQVTWKDVPMPSEPVERTLEQIVKCVTHIVPRFDRFFT